MAKSKKVNKWDAAPESIRKLKHDLRFLLDKLEVRTYDVDDPEYKELVDEIFKGLDKALDEYNELEARHQKDTGMISEYEEENKKLHQSNELCMKAHLRLIDESTELATENDDLRQERDKYSYRLERLGQALEERGIYCRWFAAELEWHLYEGKTMDDLKQHYEEELRIREKEKDEKDKLIDELHEKIEALEKENEELKAKNRNLQIRTNMIYGVYGLNSKNGELIKKIEALEKENKELKDVLEKDRELAKLVGENVVECIKYGAEHGYYEVHPLNRFDIHIEETHVGSIQDRHAIPKIVVRCNNVQTEMERDTAQHECEELNRKVKELEKEKIDLKMTLAMCERDANMARELCHTVAFNAERARKTCAYLHEHPISEALKEADPRYRDPE